MKDPLKEIEISHLEKIAGKSGEYEFDAVARFSVFGGADIVVLVECKRWKRPVDREVVLALVAKLRDVAAQKAMIFSTSGFQSGALEVAESNGIAAVTFIEGGWLYETKALDGPKEPPPWANLPRFAGQRMRQRDSKISSHLVEDGRVDALNIWFEEVTGA